MIRINCKAKPWAVLLCVCVLHFATVVPHLPHTRSWCLVFTLLQFGAVEGRLRTIRPWADSDGVSKVSKTPHAHILDCWQSSNNKIGTRVPHLRKTPLTLTRNGNGTAQTINVFVYVRVCSICLFHTTAVVRNWFLKNMCMSTLSTCRIYCMQFSCSSIDAPIDTETPGVRRISVEQV